jgi:Flp pilus assembly protein TadD
MTASHPAPPEAGRHRPEAKQRPSRDVSVPIAVGLITLLAFSPALWNGFVNWDDGYLLVANPHWRGLGRTQIHWMFTTSLLGHYGPISWLTFGFDYTIWGMRPAGYHLTSVLLHTASAILVYFVARRLVARATRLTGTPLRVAAAVSALFFSLHPLRVESVAWVTERRGVLSGALFLLTILSYLEAARVEGARRRWILIASVVVYALAMGSKASVMSLPAVLVLLDLYPLGRLSPDWRRWLDPSVRTVWAEKLPYLLVALGGALVAYGVLAPDRGVRVLSPGATIGKTAYSLWFPVYRTLLPFDLSPLYELPLQVDPRQPPFPGAVLGVLALTVLALSLARVWPAGLAAWCYQAITAAPTAVAQAGFQLTADRYTYLPSLGWALLVGAAAGALVGAASAAGRRSVLSRVAAAMIGTWLLLLGIGTWHQVGVWRSTEDLWGQAILVAPDCAICHSNLGVWLMGQGRTQAGVEHLYRAAVARPDRFMAHGRLGLAYEQVGRLSDAIEEYRRELALHPDAIEARSALGGVLIRSGRPADALGELREALILAPDRSSVQTNLGLALDALGRPEEAIPHLRRAIELAPRDGVPRLGLARVYLRLGDRVRAREEHEALRDLDPKLARELAASFGSP